MNIKNYVVSKKKASLLLFMIIFLFSGGLTACASGEFDIQSQYEASGAGDAFDMLPDYAAQGLVDSGLDGKDIASVTSLAPEDVFNGVFAVAGKETHAPLAALGIMIALLLFASVLQGGEPANDSSMSHTLNTVTALSVGICMVTPMAALVDSAGEAIEIASRFTRAFGLTFAGIMTANGQTASAAGYSAFLTGSVEASSLCANDVVMPMLRVFLALSCVSSVSDKVRIDAVIGFFEKYAKWILGLSAALISTILGISGLISASADSVGARTARFVISGSVPVVGGAVSEAYLSIKSGMSLLRNSVGAFGIIATGYIFLPVIIRTILWRMVVGIGEAFCDTMKLSDLQKLMKSLSSAVSLLLGVLIFALFLLTVGGIVVMLSC